MIDILSQGTQGRQDRNRFRYAARFRFGPDAWNPLRIGLKQGADYVAIDTDECEILQMIHSGEVEGFFG